MFGVYLLTFGSLLISVKSNNYTDAYTLLSRYPDSFVTRTGNQLYIEEYPIRFAGANIYWLALDENSSPYPTDFRLFDVFTTASQVLASTVVRCQSCGISVGNVRSFEPSLNQFNNISATHIDLAIYYAKKYNIRLVIPLIDSNNFYMGSIYTFTEWITGGTDAQNEFYTNPDIVNAFVSYIKALLNHKNVYTGNLLKDEPTILAWETGNELFPPANWTNYICQVIKNETGAQQLVMSGTFGISDAELAFPCVDLYSNHYYQDVTPTTPLLDAEKVALNNKTFMAGEYGWKTMDLDTLNGFVDTLFNGTQTNIDTYWSLFCHNDTYGFETHNDGYSLYYPGETDTIHEQIMVLRRHAYEMAYNSNQIDPKIDDNQLFPHCFQPMIHKVDANSGTIYWRGAPSCVAYDIEWLFPSNTTFSILISNVTDFTGYYHPFQTPNNICIQYRMRGWNQANVYGNYSLVYKLNCS